MSILRRLDELKAQCIELGIDVGSLQPIKGSALGKLDYVKALEKYFLEKYRREGTLTKGLDWVSMYITESPMLAVAHVPESEKEEVLNSTDWIASTKLDGFRCLLCYFPDEGITLFGRNRLVNTGVYSEYTDQLLGLRREETKGLFPFSFVLDGEMLSKTKSLDSGRTVSDTILNAVVQMISLNRQDSWKVQYQYFQEHGELPIQYNPFDLLMFKDVPLLDKPYGDRLDGLNKLFASSHFFGN